MKMALVVGINYYPNARDLYGCVNDAHNVSSVLSRHSDGSINFECKLLVSNSNRDSISRGGLKDAVEKLFTTKVELHYFILLVMDISKQQEGIYWLLMQREEMMACL